MWEVEHHDRIDFIYYRGRGVSTINSNVLGTVPEDEEYPSDHSAVVSIFKIGPVTGTD